MKIESVGSFLADENFEETKNQFFSGQISTTEFNEKADKVIRDIVERQISSGLDHVTSGEIRRKHWANDFWFGFEGIYRENITAGRIYQRVESATDLLHIAGRVAYNTNHPFFKDFEYLYNITEGRAVCRQTMPSPANLLLEIYELGSGNPGSIYISPDTMLSDICNAYRDTILRLYELGCRSIQFDDTALGLMCDDNYTKRLLQGGVDLIKLHGDIIQVLKESMSGMPNDMEKSLYISGGDKIVPEWEYIDYPDNIMPKALSSLDIDKYFLPFDIGNDYSLKILRHIPKGTSVVLGIIDAHTPFDGITPGLKDIIDKSRKYVESKNIAVSPRTGFKVSSYQSRGLTYEDQWRILNQLSYL